MRIIAKARLREYWQHSSRDKPSLIYWYKITTKAIWNKPDDVRKTFGSVDIYRGKKYLMHIFNVGGNRTRVICNINFKTSIVYILFVLPHDEYSKDKWKESL